MSPRGGECVAPLMVGLIGYKIGRQCTERTEHGKIKEESPEFRGRNGAVTKADFE